MMAASAKPPAARSTRAATAIVQAVDDHLAVIDGIPYVTLHDR